MPADPPINKMVLLRKLFIYYLLQVTVTTVDKRQRQLVFKANLLEMDNKILVDFRLSKVRFLLVNITIT